MDDIFEAIKCAICKQVLESPVILPCEHSVCKRHTDELIVDGKILCLDCGQEHTKQAFPLNRALAKIIATRIDKLDLGKDYKTAKEACEKLETVIKKIEQLLNDPNNFTHEEIGELERKLQLNQEELKKQIDDEFDKIYDKLEEYKQKCTNHLKTNEYIVKSSKISEETEKAREELREWLRVLKEVNLSNEPKWKKIKVESEKSIGDLENKIIIFKEELLLREIEQLKYQGSWLQNIKIDFHLYFFESLIVADFYQTMKLFGLCKFNGNEKLRLIYRGSRDGFNGSDFHNKCDNRPKTLTVIKADTGNIFGGYVEIEWDSTGISKTDEKAFLFSLVNKENKPCRLDIAKGKDDKAILCSSNRGPIFGNYVKDFSHSVWIHNNSNTNFSDAIIGTSFILPDNDFKCNCKYISGTFNNNNVNIERNDCQRCKFLAGNYEFKVIEIEVFQIE